MVLRRLLLAGSVLSIFVTSASARATPKTHDGFYLRVAAGAGGLDMQRSVDAEIAGFEWSGDSTISGGVFHFEGTVGGSPARGLVIGGSLLTFTMGEAEIENEAGDAIELASPLRFFVIGPTIDWFPSARGGFHVGATLGLAAAFARLPEDQAFEGIGGGGGALSLALGYDWWIADEWSLGALLRLTGAGVSGEDEEAGVTAKEESSIGAVTIAFTALFH